jgi:hypothetical protein
MSIITKVLAIMVEKGCSPEQMLAVTQVVADEVKNIESEALERVREKARDRQRRHREKVASNVMSRDVTLCNVSVTLPSSPPSMVSPLAILYLIIPPFLNIPLIIIYIILVCLPKEGGKGTSTKGIYQGYQEGRTRHHPS